MVPGFNPDGEIMVTDWYNKYLGTEYEGSNPPWLYQKYVGHDNNRDAFMQNMVESQYMGQLLFREWKPQAYVDHHGMGANGARIFLPPYAEPVRPFADPLAWRELAWYGADMATKESQANRTGAINNAIYSGWATWVSTGSRRSTTSSACSPSRRPRSLRRRSRCPRIDSRATRGISRERRDPPGRSRGQWRKSRRLRG